MAGESKHCVAVLIDADPRGLELFTYCGENCCEDIWFHSCMFRNDRKHPFDQVLVTALA